MDSQFEGAALDAGFTQKQIEFMDEFLAKYPHTHNAEDINGLEEFIEAIEEDEEEEED